MRTLLAKDLGEPRRTPTAPVVPGARPGPLDPLDMSRVDSLAFCELQAGPAMVRRPPDVPR
jgi:hypothetical protein